MWASILKFFCISTPKIAKVIEIRPGDKFKKMDLIDLKIAIHLMEKPIIENRCYVTQVEMMKNLRMDNEYLALKAELERRESIERYFYAQRN